VPGRMQAASAMRVDVSLLSGPDTRQQMRKSRRSL
jgi:hypothetical protein